MKSIVSHVPTFFTCLAIVTLTASGDAADSAVDYEYPPISYSDSMPDNRISRLQAAIVAGEKKLERTDAHGYLVSLLKELEISPSSQVLPFAKVSLQDGRISPSTPRALYFNEETYVGYVQNGVIEIAVSDPKLGISFYTLSQKSESPYFHHETNRCLTCHGSVRARNVPGLMVRSVHPDPDGQPVIAAGSFRTDHSSPLKQRWGGWYVSGTHGDQTHLGNFRLPDNRKPKSINNAAGQNVTDLSKFFDVKPYLTPHSDLVALMVLEHQIDAQNYLTRASFETRIALHKAGLSESITDRAMLPSEAGDRINATAEAVAKHLMFVGETKLTAPIRGTSAFTAEFVAGSSRQVDGAALRDFDLQTRLFKSPLSYMIDSPAFDALPPVVKSGIVTKLDAALEQLDRDSTKAASSDSSTSQVYSHRDITAARLALRARMNHVSSAAP